MFDFLRDLFEIVFGEIAKMNVANCENSMFFLVWFIEAIASMIKAFHYF